MMCFVQNREPQEGLTAIGKMGLELGESGASSQDWLHNV